MKKTGVVLLLAALLGGCSYGHQRFVLNDAQRAAMAEDSRRVQDDERAELAQHRRQRANKRDQINGAMGTAAGAVGLIGSIAGTAALIKAWF